MALDRQALNDIFETAKQFDFKFVFVGISAEGIKEVIAVPNFSFDKKLEFYNNAYSDNLVHVMNSNVFVEWVYAGDDISEAWEMWEMLDIEEELEYE